MGRAVVDVESEISNVGREDGNPRNDWRGVFDPCESRNAFMIEPLCENREVVHSSVRVVNCPSLNRDAPQLRERPVALLKHEPRVP